jgi:putative transposase
MPTKLSTRKVRRVYEFIKANRDQYDVKMMCRVLEVTRSGYYAWLHEPISHRAQEDVRLLRLIRASFVASHGVYGAPRVFLDLREAGETCSKHRVARLMRVNKTRAVGGYREAKRKCQSWEVKVSIRLVRIHLGSPRSRNPLIFAPFGK